VLVSNLYLSIRSLSPENHPSSFPPDLTALVLTLFEVGRVDSVKEEKEQRKTHTRIARDVARDDPIGCSCERDQLQQILKQKQNHTAFNDVSGYQTFREKRLDQALHRKCQKRQKITWSSHVIFD